jgi:desulfoferrodoxin (superoxide reductase-like protein)
MIKAKKTCKSKTDFERKSHRPHVDYDRLDRDNLIYLTVGGRVIAIND